MNRSQGFHVLPVLPLTHKGFLGESAAFAPRGDSRIGRGAGICLHKRETFGQGLSQAQTSVSQRSAADCQRLRALRASSCKFYHSSSMFGSTEAGK